MDGNQTYWCKLADVTEKGGIVRYFYDREDPIFFEKVHKRHGTREECIKDTCESLPDIAELYQVFEEDRLVAFFSGYEWGVLDGFHVIKEKRNTLFLSAFWKIVKEHFKGNIVTPIYHKNEPALRSLYKAGFKKTGESDVEGKVFFILKYEVCQQEEIHL